MQHVIKTNTNERGESSRVPYYIRDRGGVTTTAKRFELVTDVQDATIAPSKAFAIGLRNEWRAHASARGTLADLHRSSVAVVVPAEREDYTPDGGTGVASEELEGS